MRLVLFQIEVSVDHILTGDLQQLISLPIIEKKMTLSNNNMIAAESAAKWDLTSSVSPHLDLHMMFPLLEYVDNLIAEGLISYSAQDVAAARLSLLRPTHMVDYAMDIYKELHANSVNENEEVEIPREMEDQKLRVFERLEELRTGCAAFDELWRPPHDEKRVS